MSVLFESDDGWIISHLRYLNNIYKNVEVNQETKIFEFNKILFNINSPYLRENQIKISDNSEDKANSLKKRKRKRSEKLPDDALKQNDFVKSTATKMFNDGKDLNLFNSVKIDHNEESRLEANKFYSNKLQLNYNYFGNNEKEIACIENIQHEDYIFPKNSKFYCYDVQEINEKLAKTNSFDLILLDPPWWNKSIRRKKIKLKESSYKMMSNEEIANIPIKNFLNSKGIVAVWCTNSTSQSKYILEQMFPRWGVTFKAKWYWLKITQSGVPICDFNEQHGKQPYELLVFGTVPTNVDCNIPNNKIIISVPSAIHSHKPPLTEVLKPYLPENPKCMEIFARYLLPEWTSWGLEVLKLQHLSLYIEV